MEFETCKQCGGVFHAPTDEVREDLKNATPEECQEWHGEASS